MAIDSTFYGQDDQFASREKTFYPLRIPISHWQLRHYISHPEKDVLYYASGQDIYSLNTSTHKRKHIATLPFEARCTASGYGYICVGGEDEGHFAIIKLDGGRSAEVDAPLPLNHWQRRRTASRDEDPPTGDWQDDQQHTPSFKVERIGEEIVNSISIHSIQDADAHLYDVVAVLTNNDRTVRVYSLWYGVETAKLTLPFPMNHATISPDGRMLAAVGDVNMIYFFERSLKRDPPQIPKPHNRLATYSACWNAAGSVQLHVPRPTPRSGPHTGYFTTAWSPNGHLLAVGSEAGSITVFDMREFQNLGPEEIDAAIVAVVSSSRPDIERSMHPGAVRSMLFSPDPWHFLIWAEDQGRICIGDLRTRLRTRQVIDLDPKDEQLTRLNFQDLPADDLPSTLHGGRITDRPRGVMSNADYLDAQGRLFSRHARQSSRRNTSLPEDDPHGLTAHEQRVLESLRTTRQREEARAQGDMPRSVNYTSSSLFQSSSTAAREESGNTRSPRTLRDALRENAEVAALPETDRATTDREDPLPPLHAIQEYLMLREQTRQQEETSSSQPAASAPRWQISSRRPDAAPSTSAHSSSLVPPHALRATLPSTSTPPNDDENPWRTISDALSETRGPLFESTRAVATSQDEHDHRSRILSRQRERLRELQHNLEVTNNAAAAEANGAPSGPNWSSYELLRGTANAVRGLQDGYDLLRRRGARSTIIGNTVSGREIGVRTAGLAISKDGRTLWAASEDGIFELKLNIKRRMVFPAVELR